MEAQPVENQLMPLFFPSALIVPSIGSSIYGYEPIRKRSQNISICQDFKVAFWFYLSPS